MHTKIQGYSLSSTKKSKELKNMVFKYIFKFQKSDFE